MIRFHLRCSDGHDFDSWFQSSAAFDTLAAAGRLECAVCGSRKVGKAPMAPALVTAPADAAARPAPDLRAPPDNPIAAALAAFRRHVEENSEYVGMRFAAEARAIHEGQAPGRAIYGEAQPDEARKLIEDGVPVTPLPFLPARRVN